MSRDTRLTASSSQSISSPDRSAASTLPSLHGDVLLPDLAYDPHGLLAILTPMGHFQALYGVDYSASSAHSDIVLHGIHVYPLVLAHLPLMPVHAVYTQPSALATAISGLLATALVLTMVSLLGHRRPLPLLGMRINQRLYGVIITAVPAWLATSLHLTSRNDGVLSLRNFRFGGAVAYPLYSQPLPVRITSVHRLAYASAHISAPTLHIWPVQQQPMPMQQMQ